MRYRLKTIYGEVDIRCDAERDARAPIELSGTPRAVSMVRRFLDGAVDMYGYRIGKFARPSTLSSVLENEAAAHFAPKSLD